MMKRTFSTLILLAACVLSANAQVYLIDALKPTEKHGYREFRTSGLETHTVGSYMSKMGFSLDCAGSGTITQMDPGYVVFNLNGAYSKLTFVLGPVSANPNGDKYNSVATVTADGRRLLDEIVRDHDTPRYITLDVTGVDELKFYTPRGEQSVGFGEVQLWKAGETVVLPKKPIDNQPAGKIQLVEQLRPYYTRYNGYAYLILKDNTNDLAWMENVDDISINRKKFTSGVQFTASQGLIENEMGWTYFWLDKRYDKLSFIVGPRDNQSSNASAWLIVKADGKTIFEEVITQKDLARQVVLDVKGVNQIAFMNERRSGDLLGSITFGLVDMYAYPAGDSSVPTAGEVNVNKEKISKLPDVCPLMSSIRPFSVRGVSSADHTMFYGESKYITFSMGGEKFYEGIVLPTGTTLLDDNINAYAEFDLAGEFDWISFEAGNLTQVRVLDDDLLRVYADDKLVLETMIHATWPNQHFEVPVYKCRTLRFEKPGTGQHKQSAIGLGDITLYRGKPVKNDLFEHERPDMPYEADLIDLCQRPYFHFVGRYLSTITNFDFNDCFKNGSSQREYFQMHDGSKIYKGVMLEANVPLGFEDISLVQCAFMFVCGVAPSITNSDVSASTGVSAGASPVGGLSLLLTDPSKRQASVAAFNPYGEYESCTFSVALKSPHVNEFSEVFGGDKTNPVKLNVFADQRLVGEYWLTNDLKPFTVTVPIFKCHQLMFWLECTDTRSAQYVLYDMKVSKAPCNLGIPASCSKSPTDKIQYVRYNSGAATAASESISIPKAEWSVERLSQNDVIDSYLNDVTATYKAANAFTADASASPELKQTWVRASNGQTYKCITYENSAGQRANIIQLRDQLQSKVAEGKEIMNGITLKQPGVMKVTRAISGLGLADRSYFNQEVQKGSAVLTQCFNDVSGYVNRSQSQLDLIQSFIGRALDVMGIKSTPTALIVKPAAGEAAPPVLLRLEDFNF